LNNTNAERGRQIWLKAIQTYRDHLRNQALGKHQTLSYKFHIETYCSPSLQFADLSNTLGRREVNPNVSDIPTSARSGLIYLFERVVVVNRSPLHQWWYLLFPAGLM
jgi:hypothetical protein